MTPTAPAELRARCRGLAQTKDPADVPFLAACLESRDRGVQDAAFDALRTRPAQPVLAALLPFLRHPQERVRNLARELLAPLGGQDPSTVLPYLEDADPNVRIFAVEVLEGWRKPGFAKALEPLSSSKDANVRNQVAISLGKAGISEGLPILSRLLKDEDEWVRFAAEEALLEIREKGVTKTEPPPPPAPAPRPPDEARPAPGGSAPPLHLADEQFSLFRNFIYSNSGLHFGKDKQYLLESRLGSRVWELGLRGADDYYAFLTRGDQLAAEELGRLFEAVTNNETSFFRSIQQFNLLRDQILPRCLEERRSSGSQALRIWCAGCSTGEEPYTVAIVVREKLGADLAKTDLKILAMDISARALDVARAGRYPQPALRAVPPRVLEAYFSPNGAGTWDLDPKIKAMVEFQRQNLSAIPPDKAPRDFDVILCRNVMMYFDAESKKRVLGRFFDSLRPGGRLIVGATESLHGITRAFRMVVYDHAVVYQKEELR